MLRINLNDDIFGNEAGEDEDPKILEKYFVTTPKFNKFFDFERKISVVNAKKGMGKSALLMTLNQKLIEDNQNFVIKETGNNLLGLGDFSSTDPSYLENYWKQVICQRINIEIGNKIKFALDDTAISLVEAAEINGFKSKNLLSALLDRLEIKLPLIPQKKVKSSVDPIALLKNFQETHKNEKIWLLIDDIDAKYLDDEKNQAKVGAFFSAIRSLANEMDGLYIRSTIRSDVWTNLRYLEDLDKWEQYIIEINWTQRQIRDILAKQILAYVQRTSPDSKEARYSYEKDYNKIFDLIFESPINWQNSQQSIFNAIHAFSNKRPRWLNQVCRMALEKTTEVNSKAKKVKLENFNQIMQKFGKNRKADLLKEHKHQFIQLDTFIDSFRGHKREYLYNELIVAIEKYFIRDRPNSDIGTVDGVTYKEAHDLANFAYKIGIISNKDGTKFTHYNDDPDLFDTQKNRNNELTWSVHISYWEYLGLKN
mgnify:CR=1 FL=1